MKKYYLIILLLFTAFSFAQIPSNYYDSADGLSGDALKTELSSITTNGHTARTYDQLYDGVGITGSQGYVDTHSDVSVSSGNIYENDGTVLDLYSEKPFGADSYNFIHNVDNGGDQTAEGDCYNREHLIPQSSFNSNYPMQSDIHHVIPTDCRVNNFRGSLPFGNVATANWTSTNGSKRGSSDVVGYSGTMFEPIDEFKGDIARALLYFATRYESTVYEYTSFDMFIGTMPTNGALQPWAIDLLLDWHYNVDPVDQRERDRNNAAYNFQGNANPFVDHPEYANMIWNQSPDNTAPTIPTNLATSNPTSSTIDLSWTASTDAIGVTNYDVYVGGSLYVSTNSASTTYTVTGLTSETTYSFTILAKDAADNMSAQSTAATGTTTTGSSGGTTTELFFSEYIEGSSFNKALEIANFTGNTIDLSSYSVLRDGNGGGTWDAGVTLSGMLSDGEVYVIANASISAACLGTTVVDLSIGQSNSPTNFNGNDPIGLFKDGTLIDIIGAFGGGTTDFAANTTLVRNPDVTGPNTTYTESEWTSFASDTCTDLGSHTINTLSINRNDNIKNITFYPNPLKGNKLYIDTNQILNIEIFNILGKRLISDEVNSNKNNLNLSDLNSGIYLIKISNGNQTFTKKLIKQ